MEDAETQTESFRVTERTSLLPSDARAISLLRAGEDYIGAHILTVHGEHSLLWKTRSRLQNFFSSKWGHYAVILLVSLDVAGIFADFLISQHICEHSGEEGFNQKLWEDADDILDITSLVFSCLFMLELILSVWAFGFR